MRTRSLAMSRSAMTASSPATPPPATTTCIGFDESARDAVIWRRYVGANAAPSVRIRRPVAGNYGEREHHAQLCAFARPRADVEAPADECDSFAHAEHPESRRRRVRVEATPVVGYNELDVRRVGCQHDPCACRLGVLRRVGERLLDEAVDRAFDLRLESARRAAIAGAEVHVQIHPHRAGLLAPVHERLES